MKKRRVGNRGFSLIELIVVVAIMALVTTFFTIGVSLLTTKAVDQCAKKIQIALESNRNTTMGKLEANISFYVDAKGNVYAKKHIINTNDEIIKISDNSVKVTYTVGGASTPLSATPLVITFDRASGALKAQPGGGFVSELTVTNVKGSKTLHVKIDKLTGRVTVE